MTPFYRYLFDKKSSVSGEPCMTVAKKKHILPATLRGLMIASQRQALHSASSWQHIVTGYLATQG